MPVRDPGAVSQYKDCVIPREVAAYVARWKPAAGTPAAAAQFARQVVTAAAPGGRDRAKCLLWAAGKLAGWAIGLGMEPVPRVLLHPSVIERFTAHAGLSDFLCEGFSGVFIYPYCEPCTSAVA